METTKILETEKENKDAVHLYWNEADETWNAYGTSVENALRINPELPCADGQGGSGWYAGDTPESDHRTVRAVRPCRLLRGGGRREIETEDTRAWLNERT